MTVRKFLNDPEAQGPWLSIRDRQTSESAVEIRLNGKNLAQDKGIIPVGSQPLITVMAQTDFSFRDDTGKPTGNDRKQALDQENTLGLYPVSAFSLGT